MKKEVTNRYIAYLRRSSEQEDRQVLSIPSQRSELEQIAKREGLNIVEWVEEAHSAKHPNNRPKFDNMIKAIQSKKTPANCIITWNPNRLSRNAVDTGAIVYLLDLDLINEVRTPQQIFRNTPNDKFLLNLFCSQAKLENDNKGEDVKRGLNKKAKMGWRPSGAPIGYLNTPDLQKGFKTIKSDPERFNTVRRMWDLMLTGNYTVPQIWRTAKSWDLVTVKHRRIGGKHLSRSAVYTLFTNPFYYGWFIYKDRDSSEMMWQKGEHKPMVTEEEYDRVQQLLGRKGNPRPKNIQHDLAFTGSLMMCANCGSSITAETKVKRQKNGNVHNYVYYHCTHRKDENCTQKSIELKELDKQVVEILDSLKISEAFKDWAIKNLHEIRTTEANSNETIIKNKHLELEKVLNQLDSLMLKYTSPENTGGNLISDNEYQNMKSNFLKRKSSLEIELNQKGKEVEQWVELSEKTFNFACYSKAWYENGDSKTKRSILACLGSNLILKDQKININLHPFFFSLIENKNDLVEEKVPARTSKNALVARQKGTFVPLSPTGLRG